MLRNAAISLFTVPAVSLSETKSKISKGQKFSIRRHDICSEIYTNFYDLLQKSNFFVIFDFSFSVNRTMN